MDSSDFLGAKYLYRFRGNKTYFIDELRNAALYFPSKSQLNDPFDCYTKILRFDNSSEIIRKKAFAEIRKRMPNQTRQQIRSILRDMSSNELIQTVKDRFETLMQNSGIGSFSITPANLMLWSHYANWHQCVCLGFNIENDEDFFNQREVVRYVDEISQFDYSGSSRDFVRVATTKSNMWRDEREVRILKPKYGSHSFKKKALIRVIFGLKCEDSTIRECMKICKNEYDDLKLYVCEPSENEFGIDLYSL
ncbi:DUF2971 domain-containing protein [Ekhidna sp.]|uniref:DUF2971 domain-containing protein n=1 Tax=Ekhidna sp. TaxID=2608089 RepID=UPI003CCB8554